MAHSSLMNHRKTKRLMRLLDRPRFQVVGLLECLWHVVHEDLHIGDDGFLWGWTHDDIEEAAGWDGDRGAFVDAALAAGFLDAANGDQAVERVDKASISVAEPSMRPSMNAAISTPQRHIDAQATLPIDGSGGSSTRFMSEVLIVHNYGERAPGYIRDRFRKRREREQEKLTGGGDEKAPPVPDIPRVPDPTRPDPTQPNPDIGPAPESVSVKGEDSGSDRREGDRFISTVAYKLAIALGLGETGMTRQRQSLRSMAARALTTPNPEAVAGELIRIAEEKGKPGTGLDNAPAAWQKAVKRWFKNEGWWHERR